MTTRLAGICAALFVILMVVGLTLATDSPDTDAPDQEWLDYVRDDGNLIRNIIGAYLMVIAAVLFLVFLAAMYRRLRPAEGGDGLWSLVMLVTGVAWASALAAGAILNVTTAGAIEFGQAPEPTVETARWFSQLGFGVFLVGGGLCVAASAAALSTLILQTKALPAWVGYFGYLAALAMVFAAFFIPLIIFGLWMLVLGIVLVTMSEPAAPAPARA
jgi:hypothetical protein